MTSSSSAGSAGSSRTPPEPVEQQAAPVDSTAPAPSPVAKTPATPPGTRRNTLDTVTTAGKSGAPTPGGNGAVGAVTLVTFDALRRDALVQTFIKRADAQLGVLGY